MANPSFNNEQYRSGYIFDGLGFVEALGLHPGGKIMTLSRTSNPTR
jgi:hypothetical protein